MITNWRVQNSYFIEYIFVVYIFFVCTLPEIINHVLLLDKEHIEWHKIGGAITGLTIATISIVLAVAFYRQSKEGSLTANIFS